MCLRNKIPRSSKKDSIQGLGHCSPTIAAEEELMKWVEVDLAMCLTIRPTIYPTNESLEQFPRTDLRGRRRSSSKKDKNYDPSTRIHTYYSSNPAALRLQRRTPPIKLEGENPNGFRSRSASKSGSNCGATGFRGRE